MAYLNNDLLGFLGKPFEGMNIFGAKPSATTQLLAKPTSEGGYGLLSQDMLQKAEMQSLGKGLLTTLASYLAQPKNKGYGSALPYLAGSYLEGMTAAQKPFEELQKTAFMQDQISTMQSKKQIRDQLLSDPRVQSDPILKAAVDADPMGVYKQLTTGSKAPTQRTREAPVDEDNDGKPDYIEKIYEEWSPKENKFVEVSRTPKDLSEEHIPMNEGAIDMAASGYVLDGTLPPLGRGKSARNDRTKILNRAEEMIKEAGGNPLEARLQARLNVQEFKSREIALKNFSTGVEGRKVRSLNTAMAHLESMKEWSNALNNNDIRKVNVVANELAKEIGNPNVTNFNFAKQIVADEVLTSVVQAGGSMQERQELQNAFDAANSPEQLMGVIESAHELMAGQLQSLELQYKSSVGDLLAERNPFINKLSPTTQELYNKLKIGGNRKNEPQKTKQIKRTGTTKDGRKVIEYADGSIEYAN